MTDRREAPTSIEAVDLEKMEKVAREATPGEYVALSCPELPTDCCDYGVVSVALSRETCRVWSREDAVFFATFDPPTVLSLLQSLRNQEAEIERLRGALHTALREACGYAREAGEAVGRLEMSEAAGIVRGWQERAQAAEAENARLREALEPFAILANEDTDYLPDEHVISLTYDDSKIDPDLGGPNTLLGERFMRAFRAARSALTKEGS